MPRDRHGLRSRPDPQGIRVGCDHYRSGRQVSLKCQDSSFPATRDTSRQSFSSLCGGIDSLVVCPSAVRHRAALSDRACPSQPVQHFCRLVASIAPSILSSCHPVIPSSRPYHCGRALGLSPRAAGGIRPGIYGLFLPTNCLPSDLAGAGSFTTLYRVSGNRPVLYRRLVNDPTLDRTWRNRLSRGIASRRIRPGTRRRGPALLNNWPVPHVPPTPIVRNSSPRVDGPPLSPCFSSRFDNGANRRNSCNRVAGFCFDSRWIEVEHSASRPRQCSGSGTLLTRATLSCA